MDPRLVLTGATAFLAGSVFFLSGWVLLRYWARKRKRVADPSRPRMPFHTWLFVVSYWLLVVALLVRVMAVGTAYSWIYLPGLGAGVISLFLLINFHPDSSLGATDEPAQDRDHRRIRRAAAALDAGPEPDGRGPL